MGQIDLMKDKTKEITKEIKDKNLWETFLTEVEEKSFLQSWNWGDFQKAMGNKIWRLGIYKGSKLLSVALVIKIEAKRGKFLFLPHGPAIKIQNCSLNFKTEILKVLLNQLKRIAKQENCSFVRIAPIWQRNEENQKIFKDLAFREAPLHMHPELTWQLDITLPEQELLMGMRKTTRYLIKQGLKNDELNIEKSRNLKDIEIFNALYQETVARHHFVGFSLDYLKNEFQAFSPDNQILIFVAKYKQECLASSLIIFWQEIAFYHQGASSQKYSKIPASYLLQWEAIKEAKKRGCKVYNFWGIAEQDSKKHPWWGLTLFKKGFGGYAKAYLKTQDLPLSFKYWLTFSFEKLRKKKRGF